MNTQQTYQTEVAFLATMARIGIDLGVSPEDAVRRAAEHAVEDGHNARTRGAGWARETSTEEIDAALFRAAVARDVLDGTVSRPSVGNVRDAVFAAL